MRGVVLASAAKKLAKSSAERKQAVDSHPWLVDRHLASVLDALMLLFLPPFALKLLLFSSMEFRPEQQVGVYYRV